jgi:hypothetical protein
MQEFIDELARLRSQSGALASDLAKKHKIPATEQPIGALGMSFNYLTAALEHTSHYQVAWGKASTDGLTAEEIASKRGQNGERLVMLSKTAFVWCMSSVEYAMKTAMGLYPGVLGEPIKNLYLGQVIELSAKRGLIDDARRPLWYGANKIRNRLVHNNGIGDENREWKFSDALTITMRDGEMIRGTIMTFPHLIGWLIVAFADWCDAFLSRRS